MKQFDIKISVEPNGRLISEMVRLFNEYNSEILITKDDVSRNVKAKSLIGLRSLSIHQFDILHITLIGVYEQNDFIDLQDQLKFLMLKY